MWPQVSLFSKRGKKAGEVKQVQYFVGNDSNRSIDVYLEKKQGVKLVDQYLLGDQGVQALDMVFSEELGQLFVVDGLAGEVKILLDLMGSWSAL